MTVNVLCHIERLPDYGTAETYFSLNLTVALDANPGNLDPKLVSPWMWKVASADVYFEQAGKLTTLDKTEVARLGDPVVDDKFTKKLAGVRDDMASDLERFVWKPDSSELTRDGADLRWSDFLIHSSTFPAALAQQAGLSMIFKVAVPANADRIIVAPRIDFGDGAVHEPKKSTNDDLKAATELKYIKMGAKDADKAPFFYAWTYTPSAPDVIAYQRECRLDQLTVNDQFLDVKSGWVKGTAETQAEDWALVLEARASAAFDLPQRMIEALLVSNTAIDDANRQPIVEAVIAAFHDIAGTGSRRPAGAKIVHELARHVLRDLDETRDPAPFLQLLATFDQNLTFAAWQELLTDAIRTQLFVDVANENVIAELQRIHGLLSDESTLRQLLLAQWKIAVSSDDSLSKLLDNDALLTDILPRHNLRKAFLFEALQEVWGDVSALGSAKTRDQQIAELKKGLLSGLGTYFTNRFKAVGPNDSYHDFNPPAAALSAGLQTVVTDHLKDYVGNTFAPFLISDDKSDEEHDALVIQLADVRQGESDTVSEDDQNESARKIAGYGVLLRRTSANGTSPWSCLNLAHVVDAADPDTKMVDDPLPVPVRLGFRHGVRQTFIDYQNAPLIAENPLLQALQETNKLGTTFSEDTTQLFRYRNPYGAGGGMPKLVPLVYGDRYEAAPFAIGNGGALPAGLAKTTVDGGGTIIDVEPWKQGDPNPPAGAIRTLEFRRRMPVGLPRVRPKNEAGNRPFEQLALPPIPRSVLPLARSKSSTSGGIDDTPAKTSRPLLLLRTADAALKTFDFFLLPPSVDIHTWDRWKAATATPDERIAVWQGYHELADEIGAVMKTGVRGDLTVDDPAVDGWSFTLTQVYPGTSKVGPKTTTLVPAGGELLEKARHKPIHISVTADGNAATPSLTVTPADCSIVVPPGEVWKLEITPTVDQALYQKNFIRNMPLPEPLTIDIEATPKTIPFEPAELLEALVVSHQKSDDRDDLLIEIDGSKLIHSGPWMHRVEAVLQQWRWSGRPVIRPRKDSDPVAFDDGFTAGREPDENDDAVLFADRSPLDAMVIPNLVDLVAEPDKKYVLHRRDLRGTKGALYFRVALRCISRYEGIVDAEADSRNAKTPESWARTLVRCRWTAPVPKPVIKLVLPLTRPIDGTTPPLLVVLDEPWGDAGGLAETLAVDLVEVTRGDDGTTLQEIGPDPILTAEGNQTAFNGIAPIGPIGYTFDTDTDAPLFVKSSFIVPPPVTADDLSWYFVKLQFRRVLNGQWMLTPGGDVSSDATQPVWCQYLPPSTRFSSSEHGTIDVADLSLHIEGTTASFVSKQFPKLTLLPFSRDALSRSRFELYVILTKPIVDASGRPDQEVFAGVHLLDGATFTITETAPLRARIIEVQRRLDRLDQAPPDANDAKNLWEELFLKDPSADVNARIVRISPPIE